MERIIILRPNETVLKKQGYNLDNIDRRNETKQPFKDGDYLLDLNHVPGDAIEIKKQLNMFYTSFKKSAFDTFLFISIWQADYFHSQIEGLKSKYDTELLDNEIRTLHQILNKCAISNNSILSIGYNKEPLFESIHPWLSNYLKDALERITIFPPLSVTDVISRTNNKAIVYPSHLTGRYQAIFIHKLNEFLSNQDFKVRKGAFLNKETNEIIYSTGSILKVFPQRNDGMKLNDSEYINYIYRENIKLVLKEFEKTRVKV